MLGFTQSHQGPLNDIEGFFQILPGSYKSDKPIKITGIDKIRLKCDCINGSIVNGVREPILFCTVLLCLHHPDIKYTKNQESIFFEKINKSVLSRIKFYLEDDDHKPVDFNKEAITFTCQLIKYNFRIYIIFK